MRLAASIEAAHPHPRLLLTIEVTEIGGKDALQTLGILPFAHEGFELVTQGPEFLVRSRIHDLGHPLVDEAVLERVLEEDIAIVHAVSNPVAAVIGTAW